MAEAEALPIGRRFVVAAFGGTTASSDFPHGVSPHFDYVLLYQGLRCLRSIGRVGPLLFHRLLSRHPVPLTPEGSWTVHPKSSRRPWPSPDYERLGSLFPFRANVSTLQDSLDVTGCRFARPPRPVTPLRHTRLPKCNGRLLRGPLAVTATGLPPASRR